MSSESLHAGDQSARIARILADLDPIGLRGLVPDLVEEYRTEADDVQRRILALRRSGKALDQEAVSGVVTQVFRHWFDHDMSSDEAGEAARRVLAARVSELAVDVAEAQALVRAELEEARNLGYRQLRQSAPRLAPEPEQPPRFLRRWFTRWENTPESRRQKRVRGASGALYQVVREIDWDAGYGGTLRIWAHVEEVDSIAEPVYDSDLIHPPTGDN